MPTKAKELAGAIMHSLNKSDEVVVRAVGSNAVNQMVKGIAICRGYVLQSGGDFSCFPAFEDVTIEEETQTAIKFIIRRK